MLNRHLEGATRNVGRSQGFLGISVLYRRQNVQLADGRVVETATSAVAWEPTPAELERLRNGASFVCTFLMEQVPPMIVEVGQAPTGEEQESRDARGVPHNGAAAFRAGYKIDDTPKFERPSFRMEWMAQYARAEADAMRAAEDALLERAEKRK